MDGILVVNKPSGMTSHDVVAQVRKKLDTRKVGHVGTLDPLATGVLVLCVGKALKLAEFLVGSSKSYRAVAMLGATSSTGDAEGAIESVISRELPFPKNFLEAELVKLEGVQKQTPSKYSAVKIKGVPAHRRVRRGEDFEVPERVVEVMAVHFIRFQWPELEFKVKCSSGTYVRSLIETLGENLKCGAYMSALKRTRSGGFTLRDAVELEDVCESDLLPMVRGVEHLPRIKVTDPEIEKLRQGQVISTTERFEKDPGPLVLFGAGEVVGIGKYDAACFCIRPTKILAEV